MGYVCLCRMLNWDCRCIVLLTGWIWKHWILMLDGLTPKMKFLLGYRTQFALPLTLFAVLGHLFPSLDLLLSNASEELQNQVLWSATVSVLPESNVHGFAMVASHIVEASSQRQ
uniref:Uncharacterized protein n=1 Tax=Globisporangium ultimum (strain ATCC 200006 / CBS 805.95 / DAOM BR144) TaxID=431595 RepID=K3WWL5_GLOUD